MRMRILIAIILLPFFCDAQIIRANNNYRALSVAAAGCSDADATAYCTAAGITGSDATAICEFVVREKAAGRWGTELQAVYILSNGSFNAVRYNLIDATATLTTPGTINYTTGSGGGVTQSGNSYFDTHFNPSTDLVSSNSAHIAFFSQSNINEGSTDMGIAAGGLIEDIELFNTVMYSTVFGDYTTNFLQASLSTTKGFFLSNRTSSTAVEIRQDNTSLATGSKSIIGVPNANLLLFTSNGANYSTKKFAFMSIGAAISNPTDYYNSVTTLLTDLGVIP